MMKQPHELADRIELYLTFKGIPGFHLSDDDFRSIVAALRGVSGERPIWLRREGDHIIVLVECNNKWAEVIREYDPEGTKPVSHIWEDQV